MHIKNCVYLNFGGKKIGRGINTHKHYSNILDFQTKLCRRSRSFILFGLGMHSGYWESVNFTLYKLLPALTFLSEICMATSGFSPMKTQNCVKIPELKTSMYTGQV